MSLAKTAVLRGLSFSAGEGEILGFLGPNGAGKTTTIKIVLGLIKPDSGSVRVLGRPVSERAVKRVIGYLPENPYFYPHLSLIEFLTFCAKLSGVEKAVLRRRIDEIISLVGLPGDRDRRLRGFSKGMIQRAGLAQAVLHDPDILILDEPFSGLDPLGRKLVRDFLLGLKTEGKTIFFSSHILPDMEALCDSTCIIKEGKIALKVGMDELIRIGEGKVEVTARNCPQTFTENIREYIENEKRTGDEVVLVVRRQELVRTVLKYLLDNGAEIIRVVNQHPTLEEVFVGEVAPGGNEGESYASAGVFGKKKAKARYAAEQ